MSTGATMAKNESKSIKISKEIWQQLKLINLVEGEDMSDLVNALLAPLVAKRYKAAKAKLDAREEEGDE